MQNGHCAQQSLVTGLIKHLQMVGYFTTQLSVLFCCFLSQLQNSSSKRTAHGLLHTIFVHRTKDLLWIVPFFLSFLFNLPPPTADPTLTLHSPPPPQPLLSLLYLGSYHKIVASNHFLISLLPSLYKHTIIFAKPKSEMSVPTSKCPAMPCCHV